MTDIQQILTKYWGYNRFRPLQEDIIQSIMDEKDTLALLPTGGGKSICFQVPALAKGGLCLVISPLIALMKDQVSHLKSRGIKAETMVSGMHPREIDITLDNCAYGGVQFLYVSPERVTGRLFRERLKKMPVTLVAVDEAHCISQWGYDFRPPYLRIAELRELLPADVPFVALTATATPAVETDIVQKLAFRKNFRTFRKSFERKNLSYQVVKEEDPYGRIVQLARKTDGSGIVYVRSRRRTKEVTAYLHRMEISADYYHAGLDPQSRDDKQQAWIRNRCQIMVATNAFGMGIDKPNVRFVVHLGLPDSPEAYFQEAGRAGRDEKKALAMLLYMPSDLSGLQNSVQQMFPEKEKIKRIYQAICNHLQVATGAGANVLYPFDISVFSKKYDLDILEVFHAIKILKLDNYVDLSEPVDAASKVQIEMSHHQLYSYQIAHSQSDGIIKLLLRSYPGLYDNLIAIDEWKLARRAGIPRSSISNHLQKLARHKVITYLPQGSLPCISFPMGRADVSQIRISKMNYLERKERATDRMNAMLQYVKSDHKCRSQMLLRYFGEPDPPRCGTCDVCLERNKSDLSNLKFGEVSEQIKNILAEGTLDLTTLVHKVAGKTDHTIKVIRWLAEAGKLKCNTDGNYYWYKAKEDPDKKEN